jgi:hypothetical protein
MKTRIVHTKIWEDDWFRELSKPAGWLFMYLITNPRINLSGMYQISLAALLFGTRFEEKEIDVLKTELAQKGKVFFYRDWVYVVNAKKYGGYFGKLCEQGISKELQEVPDEIKKCFLEGKCDTPSIPHTRVLKVQEIRNNKLEIRNKKKKAEKIEKKPEADISYLENLPEADIAYFTDEFEATKGQVIKKAKEMLDWLRSKGKEKEYKDFKALLRNAVRKDFGEKDEEKRKRDKEIREAVARMKEKDHPSEPVEVDQETAKKNIEMLDQMRKKHTIGKI